MNPNRFPRGTRRKRVVAVTALVVSVAAGAGAWSGTTSGSHPARSKATTSAPADEGPYDWAANPLANSIRVSGTTAANHDLPFSAVLPSTTDPTGLWVADPAQTLPDELQLAANFNDPRYGLFQVSEKKSTLTEPGLEQWATTCTSCSIKKVVSIGDQRVLVMGTPDRGLGVSWLRGNASGVLTIIQGPYGTFTERSALDLASDIINRGG
jgi:hypothetical protein